MLIIDGGSLGNNFIVTIILFNKTFYVTAEPLSYADGNGTGKKDIPTGGTQGQFLIKSSSTDYDCEWVTVPSSNGVSF